MRIFAAGIATETNTFAPFPTGLEDFFILRGRDLDKGEPEVPSLDLSKPWGEMASAQGAEFVFSLMAFAQPAGITVKAAYESLRDEVLSDLRAALPIQIVLLSLHGAMVADGYDDCEEDLIGRVRDLLGANAVIGVLLDLHCHLRPTMIARADLVITVKEYPHVDTSERAQELFELAVRAHRRIIRPTSALFDCRMIGIFPTTREPLRKFVDSMRALECQPGVLSVSFAHGYPFADVPHVGAKMLVITDNDPALARTLAEDLGLRLYALRLRIGFDIISLSMEEALSRALESKRNPVVVADQSDNPGGGAPGDSTFALRWLIDHGSPDTGLAILYDPQVVRIAKKAGVGATLPVRLGGKLGPLSGDPVDLTVTVTCIAEGYLHDFPQQSGEGESFPLGCVVALRSGGIDIIVSSERCQCYSPSVFEDLGIDPRRKRLLVVKSTQHFYAAFAPLAAEVTYMAGPGAVAPDPRQIPYRRLDTRTLYPWDEDPLCMDRS